MEKQELKNRKELLDYEEKMRKGLLTYELECKIKFNDALKETDRLRHSQVLEAQRIKTAEIKKVEERKRLAREFGRYQNG